MDVIEDKKSLVKIGEISSIVDDTIVIESCPSMPPLDLDSVLFREDGHKIGAIHDVFGPVKCPLYSIKMGKKEDSKGEDISTKMPVYFVPQVERSLTKFVFIDQLEKLHIGSDASWENDNEPPENALEYSDDEEEREARKTLRESRLQKKSSNTSV